MYVCVWCVCVCVYVCMHSSLATAAALDRDVARPDLTVRINRHDEGSCHGQEGMYVCICVYVYVCMCVCTSVCMYACACTCTCHEQYGATSAAARASGIRV